MLSQTRANKFSLDIAKISGIQSIEDHDAESFSGGNGFTYEKIRAGGTSLGTGSTSKAIGYTNVENADFLKITNNADDEQRFFIYYLGENKEKVKKIINFPIPGTKSLRFKVKDDHEIAIIGQAREGKGGYYTAIRRANIAYYASRR